MVLPPLVEWLRVATVFTETRFSTNVEKDDVFQVSTSDGQKTETKKIIIIFAGGSNPFARRRLPSEGSRVQL